MVVFNTINEVRACISELKKSGKSIGFVPTMGALHDGHLKLIESSVDQNDVTFSSVFVNPIQFNNPSDLEKYPRNLEKDAKLLESKGCDFVFAPSVDEMYGHDKSLSMDFGDLERKLEGKFRPGHFSGVGVVVSKLFNIVQADTAYFGQKDLQQVAIIKKLVNDLNIPVDIQTVQTVREENGLAMSSRNLRLTAEEKEKAALLYAQMMLVKNKLLEGSEVSNAIDEAVIFLNSVKGIEVEYFELVNNLTFDSLTELAVENVSICAAAFVGEVRIIDNIYIH